MPYKMNMFQGEWDRVRKLVEKIPLTDLSDVTITIATKYDILQYDGTNWVNKQDIDVLGTGNINLKSGQKIYFDA